MTNNLEKHKTDLRSLLNLGEQMLQDFNARHPQIQGRLTKEERAAAKQRASSSGSISGGTRRPVLSSDS